MSQRVAHDIDAATLPEGVEHLGAVGIDDLVRVGYAQLDAMPAAAEAWSPPAMESAARPEVKSWEGSAAARRGWPEAG